MQAKNVCYGSKDDKYGEFNISMDGRLTGIKLVHVSGGTKCCIDCAISTFGCNYPDFIGLTTVTITAADKSERLMPHPGTVDDTKCCFELPGYDGSSDEIIFADYNIPVTKGKLLKIWYIEDLIDLQEVDNDGVHCVDVFAMFEEE